MAVLWQFTAGRRRTLLLALVLGLGVSAAGLASPLATRSVLDALGQGASLVDPVLLLVVLLVVGAAVGWWQWVLLGELAEGIVYEARESMIRRYLRAQVLPLLRRPSGELVTRVTSDTVLLREAASSSLVGLVNGVVMLVGTLVLMAVLDVWLLGVTVAAIVVIVVVFVVLMPAIGVAQERSQAALGALGGTLEGTLRAIKTIKVATAEPRQLSLLVGHAAESRRQSVVAVRREAMVWTIASTGIQAVVIAILGFGAWRVSQGELDVPTLIAFLLYTFGLLEPVTTLSTNLTTLQAGLAAAARIREVEGFPLEPGDPTILGDAPGIGATAATASGLGGGLPVIELDGVTARYTPGGQAAVEDFSLSIPSRGHVALVGPSGAGKTTVLSLILRFLEPEHGQLRLHGIPYAELGNHAIRDQIAYVEQETPVVPGTIRDNLLLANPEAADDDLARVLAQVRLAEQVAAMPDGLDTVLGDTTVSGGQRQRIALARALLARPAVLLLDEATAQVDGITEAAIHAAIREHAQDRTVVTIAHRLSTVIDADQIIVMDDARVTAHGTHTQLLESSPLYRDLVDALQVPIQVPPPQIGEASARPSTAADTSWTKESQIS